MFYHRSFVNFTTKRCGALILAMLFAAAGAFAQSDPPDADKVLEAAAITPEKLSRSFAEVAKQAESAVVSIDTKGKLPDVKVKGDPPADGSEDILDFFRRQMPRRPSTSVGSGFIVDPRGYIVTNAHVVADASRITIKLDSGEEYNASVVGADEETDIAVLKIEAGKTLPFLAFGDSRKARVGDWVLAIGSPFGLSRTVTAGIISQVERETPGASVFQKFIQTDAAINRGNSGGPLVAMDGRVIGVNSQIATSTGDYNGIGFALPAREAEYVYEQIIKNGKVRRGYLGIALESVKAEYAAVYGLEGSKGAIITDVRDPKSSAAIAGLKAGDVILEFNGEKVEDARDLIARVSGTQPNETVALLYMRENGANLERRTASIKLGERASVSRAAADDGSRRKLPLGAKEPDGKPFGLTLTEMTPAIAAAYRLSEKTGLIVKEISPESFIADVKASNGSDALGEGDVIRRMNRIEVSDLKAFTDAVNRLGPGDAVVLHVLDYNGPNRETRLKIVQFTVQ